MARPDKFDAATVRRRTEEHLEQMRMHAMIHETVMAALKAFEGKVITKRLATEIGRLMGADWHVIYRHEFSWTEVKIYGAALEYKKAYTQLIAYDNDAYPNGERRFEFEYWQKRYARAVDYAERIAESEAVLPKVEQLVSAYNAATALVDATYENMRGLATWN